MDSKMSNCMGENYEDMSFMTMYDYAWNVEPYQTWDQMKWKGPKSCSSRLNEMMRYYIWQFSDEKEEGKKRASIDNKVSRWKKHFWQKKMDMKDDKFKALHYFWEYKRLQKKHDILRKESNEKDERIKELESQLMWAQEEKKDLSNDIDVAFKSAMEKMVTYQ